jgi:D-amino peptidase
MTVYLVADLEGVSGVGGYDVYRSAWPGEVAHRQRLIKLWVAEINAAVRGCLEAGAERVLVLDNHGGGDTVPLALLAPEAELIHGRQRPTWLPGLAGGMDAVLMIGHHARVGSGGHLCHTYSRTRLRDVRLNGRVIGEIGLIAGIAAEQGVPCAFASGDDVAVAEAEACVPGMRTAAVKQTLSRQSCVSRSQRAACELIQDGVGRGLAAPVLPAEWLRAEPCRLTVQYGPRDAWRALARRVLQPGLGLKLQGWRSLRIDDSSLRRAWDRFIGIRQGR